MRSRCRHVCSVVLLLLVPVVAVADLGVRIVEPRHGEARMTRSWETTGLSLHRTGRHLAAAAVLTLVAAL